MIAKVLTGDSCKTILGTIPARKILVFVLSDIAHLPYTESSAYFIPLCTKQSE